MVNRPLTYRDQVLEDLIDAEIRRRESVWEDLQHQKWMRQQLAEDWWERARCVPVETKTTAKGFLDRWKIFMNFRKG